MTDKPRKPTDAKPVFDADAEPLNADWIRRMARQRAANEPQPTQPTKRKREE